MTAAAHSHFTPMFRWHDGELDVSYGWAAIVALVLVICLAIWKGRDLL